MSKKKPDGTERLIGKCRCGHTGDSPHSQHADTAYEKGHGKCLVCDCAHFTWVGWINHTQKGGKK